MGIKPGASTYLGWILLADLGFSFSTMTTNNKRTQFCTKFIKKILLISIYIPDITPILLIKYPQLYTIFCFKSPKSLKFSKFLSLFNLVCMTNINVTVVYYPSFIGMHESLVSL